MGGEYPRKYWWVVLIIIPIALALIQIYPQLVQRGNGDGGRETQKSAPPIPVPPQVSVREIVTDPARLSLLVGDAGDIRAVLRDERGASVSGRRVQWETSNTAVARVSASGRVSAVAAGIALVSARSEGLSASTEVTVRPVPLARVRIEPERYSILAGATLPLTVELLDQRGQRTERPVSWRSENPDVARVTTTGVVKGIKFGIAGIVAESEGRAARAKVFVGDARTGMYPVEMQPARRQ